MIFSGGHQYSVFFGIVIEDFAQEGQHGEEQNDGGGHKL